MVKSTGGTISYISGTSSEYIKGDGTLGTLPTTGGGIPHGDTSGTDTYTTTISGVTSLSDGDAFLIRFTTGNTTIATLNINSIGAIPLYRNNDGELIGGDIIDGAEMLCIYNSTTSRFQVIGTAPNTLLAYVTNADTVAITKGQPVYAFGGQGDRLTVKRAYNTGDATSAQTVGLVLSTSIGVNQKGLIILNGQLDGLGLFKPSNGWLDGDAVYLGDTPGSVTRVKPHAPNHLVYLGFVTTANNGNAGRMYVRVQNGYEMDEIHDVVAQNPNNNDGLFFNTSNSLWESKSIAVALGYTPGQGTVTSVSALTLGTTGTDLSSSVATGTTTPVITLNVPTASATNRGALSSGDWSKFNGKQDVITLTTTGTSGAATFIGDTLNIPQYSGGSGSVTSVAALTLGTSGTDLNSSVANSTTTPVITLNVPTASASNRGALSSSDWSKFDGKQNAITLTTTGTSGAATFNSATGALNIPVYALSGVMVYAKNSTTYSSSGAGSQILTSLLIPANTFTAGDVVRVTARFKKVGTATTQSNITINTSASLSGGISIKTNVFNTGTLAATVQGSAVIINSTSNTQLAWTATNLGPTELVNSTSAWQESIIINWTANQYIIFSGNPSGTDVLSVIYYMIEKL